MDTDMSNQRSNLVVDKMGHGSVLGIVQNHMEANQGHQIQQCQMENDSVGHTDQHHLKDDSLSDTEQQQVNDNLEHHIKRHQVEDDQIVHLEQHQLKDDLEHHIKQRQIKNDAVLGTEQHQMKADSVLGTEQHQMKADSVLGTEQRQMKADSVLGREQHQLKDDSVVGTEQRQMNADSVLGTEQHQMKADSVLGTEQHQMKADSVLGTEQRQMKADSVLGREQHQLKDDSVLGTEQRQLKDHSVFVIEQHQLDSQCAENCPDHGCNGTLCGNTAAYSEVTNNMTNNSLRHRSKAIGNDTDAHTEDGSQLINIEIEVVPPKRLIYGLTDTPPVHFLILFALQQSFLAISTPLGTAVIVAEAVCAREEAEIQVRILSSTMLMMGLSTFAITTFGVRLPIFQGPSVSYIIPLIIMMAMPEFKCPETFTVTNPETNITVRMASIDNNTLVPNEDVAFARINAYAGSLMISGGVHFLIGFTGFVGVVSRFVGPVTIVPVVLLFGIYIHKVVVGFAESNWPVAVITAGVCLILSLYLSNRSTPIPFWNRSRGFHIIWQPLHQTFSILISILVGWFVSYIMTEYGALSNDPNSKEFNARTDARLHIITDTAWFLYPYPGQFGAPTFSSAALVSFMVSTILSVLDSIGDYSASAKIARAPPPPSFALNRGIAVEGLMSFLSGSLGCGHATVSYGENIGAMSISKVASRSVFQVVGVIYIVCAFMGKLGAFFSTIPYSVIGGSQIITFGILIGIIMSYLQLIDLNSIRNMSIIGIALLLGMMFPFWCTQNSASIDTGNKELNNIIILSLSNPSFVGGIFACILDNTVPGTLKERGILSQLKNGEAASDGKTQSSAGPDDVVGDYDHGIEVYRLPWIPNSFRKTRLARIIPIFGVLD